MNVERLSFYPPKDPRIGAQMNWAPIGAKVWFFNAPENLWRIGVIIKSAGFACVVENQLLKVQRWTHVYDCYRYLAAGPKCCPDCGTGLDVAGVGDCTNPGHKAVS